MSKRVIVTECGSGCPEYFMKLGGETEVCHRTSKKCSEENCPLPKLPSKYKHEEGEDEISTEGIDSWNSCINAITGDNKQ